MQDHPQPTAGVPQARRLRSWGASAVLVAFVAAVVYFFWPTTLGGCSTLTIVSGHSMEPTYYTGDLVWSRCGDAQVGDVVVYTPPDTGGARVIHRIIGGNGADGWLLQGDNNDFVDPWAPDDALVVGVAQVHVPRVGSVVYVVANPYVWGSLLLIATAIYLWPRPDTGDAADDESTDVESVDGDLAATDLASEKSAYGDVVPKGSAAEGRGSAGPASDEAPRAVAAR